MTVHDPDHIYYLFSSHTPAVPACVRSRPVVEQLTGEGSVLAGVAAEVVQASLNVAPELVELLGGRRAAPSN